MRFSLEQHAIPFSPSLYKSREGGGAFLRRRVSDLQEIPSFGLRRNQRTVISQRRINAERFPLQPQKNLFEPTSLPMIREAEHWVFLPGGKSWEIE
jgi:hypothetical protein